jgi:hypothetical protein
MRDRYKSNVYEPTHGYRPKPLEARSATLMPFPGIERKRCGRDLLSHTDQNDGLISHKQIESGKVAPWKRR